MSEDEADTIKGLHVTCVVKPPADLRELPLHVRLLCDAVLDTSFTVLSRFEREFRECEPEWTCDEGCKVQPCTKALHKPCLTSMDWEPILSKKGVTEKERPNLEQLQWWVKGTLRAASKLFFRRQNESEWDDFYCKKFFYKLEEDNEPREQHSIMEARVRFCYDEFELQKRKKWTAFGPERYNGKMPEPDIALHFKIHPEDDEWLGFDSTAPSYKANYAVAGNFSRQILFHLLEKGNLEPSPFSNFRKPKPRTSYTQAQRFIGYPWFIAEYKRIEGRRFVDVVTQAANAARCTLQMYSGLVLHTGTERAQAAKSDVRIPPLITMTAIGREVHIWVAWAEQPYDEDDDENHEHCRMQCIWEGDMLRTKDIIQLRSIIENTHTWAMRDLRGTISSHLDRWCSLYPREPYADKPSAHRTRSDPTPMPRTPGSNRRSTSAMEDRVTRSQPVLGEKKSASSRGENFRSASTSKVHTRPKNLDDSPSIRARNKSVRVQAPKTAVPATPKGRKSAVSRPGSAGFKTSPIVTVESVESGSEDEQWGQDEESESEDSFERETSTESFDDAASYDGDRTPDRRDVWSEGLSPETPCQKQQVRRSPRSSTGSVSRFRYDEADPEAQCIGSVTRSRGRRSLA
ncbi:hypothetical protein NLU13_6555 [Sarocladium strictum]|uniref:Uncharacterized protein n=1 Tax=Sarocladium strictum TaxID=5046 RepID=A0AA39L7E6_SARSR|nr:hypothetical protein NLU13_6555 [Sarocladium strictum]